MKFRITHELNYTYDSPVRLSTQYLRLSPRDTTRQKVLDWKIETPGQAMRTSDGYGNILHVLTLDKPVSEIWIHAGGTVETSASIDEPSDFTGIPLPPLVFLRPTELTRADKKLAAFAEGFRPAAGALSGLRELAAAIKKNDGNASAADSAHAFIACCRYVGVPARYVSGYVYQPKSGGGKAAEPIAMHAWTEAWVGERWHSFDIAHNQPIGESHIKIAVGADYLDCCPIRGVRVGGGVETLVAQASVTTGPQSKGTAMGQRQQQ
jgi:transglutaminase-like putative cysteine protease